MLKKIVFMLLPILGLSVLAGSANAQMGKIATSHVSDDSFFVIRFDIEKLKSQVPMGSKDLDMIANVMKEEAGLDLYSMQAITLQFGISDDGPFDSSFSITFENAKEMDMEAFHSNREFRLENYTETEFGGKNYLRHRSDGGPHLYFPNKKTFAMATSKGVESLISAGSGMGTMAGFLKSAPPGSEVMMAFKKNDGFSDFLKMAPEMFRGAPIADSFGSLEGMESGFGYLNLKSGTPIYVRANCKSADSATELVGELNNLIKLAKSMLPVGKSTVETQKKALEGSDDEFDKVQLEAFRTGEKAIDLAEKLLAGLKIESAEKTVTLKVEQMGGLKGVVPLVVSSMKMVFGVDSRRPRGGIEDGIKGDLKKRASDQVDRK